MTQERVKTKLEIICYPKASNYMFGDVLDFAENYAKTKFTTSKEMSIDDEGMIMPSFLMGAASYAAVCAVNEANLVIVESVSRFMTPIEVGKVIEFEAENSHSTTRTRHVEIVGRIGDIVIYEGDMKIVVIDRHPTSVKLTS